MKVLVTGATGFVGSELCVRLHKEDITFTRAVRSAPKSPWIGEIAVVGEVDGATQWEAALAGVEVVVHLAGRAHVMNRKEGGSLDEYRRTNLDGSVNLATQAARMGVRRFIFVSSVKVNGEGSETPYTSETPPAPIDPYGVSKWEAECALREIAQRTGLEVVVIRPPLIYGPGVKANFLRLISAVARGIPLPFGLVHNQRSLLFVGNLVDALVACATHPRAANKTYLLSDGDDVSTSRLVKELAYALNCPARLLPVPPQLIRLAGELSGKQQAVKRLLGSLIVDSRPIRRELGWQAPFSLQAGLQATALWYREQHDSNG